MAAASLADSSRNDASAVENSPSTRAKSAGRGDAGEHVDLAAEGDVRGANAHVADALGLAGVDADEGVAPAHRLDRARTPA